MEAKACAGCGGSKPITNFKYLGCRKSDGHIYRDSFCRGCRRKENRAVGLCTCGQPNAAGKLACDVCLRLRRENKHRMLLIDRKATLTVYGDRCSYCGEGLEPFLTVDHINEDGAEHRRSQRAGGIGGHEINSWLRKNNYPLGFQILCFNCNSAKSRIGEKDLLESLLSLDRLSVAGRLRLQCLKEAETPRNA